MVLLQTMNGNYNPVGIARSLLTNLYEMTGKLTSWDLMEIIGMLKGQCVLPAENVNKNTHF